MKILNNIFQLQDQISFCPLCQKKNRKVSIEDSSIETQIIHYRENDNKIKMRVQADPKKAISYDIDMHSNDFHYKCNDRSELVAPNLDFLITGKCPENHANAAGIFTLNASNKKIENIFYNKETLSILNVKCRYRISVLYNSDILLVSTLEDVKSKVHSFPLMDLDFAHPEKIITKIKTLLLFS